MAEVTLPDLPKGREFEELVAALYQSAGRFVERDIIERESIEILQLDVLATDYSQTPIRQCLVEAKGGDWGFTDIFKVKGWVTYLGIPDATLVISQQRDRLELYKRLAAKVGVGICLVENIKNPTPLLDLLGVAAVHDMDVVSWRFLYWVERNFLRLARQWRSGEPSAKRYWTLLDHAFRINSGIFFEATAADRVSSLYNTFSECQNLAGRCGFEMNGGDFDDEGAQIPSEIFNRTFQDDEINEIQVACWLEHRARLAILKAATDYLAYKQDGQTKKAEKVVVWKIGGREFRMPMFHFPSSFSRALDLISQQPNFRRYAVLWQWFLGVFGGFILLDYEEQDYELLSARSGVPVGEVPVALGVFDNLFPHKGGWFRVIGESRIRQLMLMPSALKGVGSNYRRFHYTADGRFESLNLTGRYTRNDLIRWNNCTVELLSR